MATDSTDFNDLAKRLEALSPQQRAELIERLERLQTSATTSHNGRSALDGFKERGLIGSITDAPADWSTNPKYMEGFGSDAS